MRGLLGTLRDPATSAAERDGRAPEPGLGRPARRWQPSARHPAARHRLDVVEASPGAAQQCPAPSALSLYRTAQEALANTAATRPRPRPASSCASSDRSAVRARLRRGRGARRRPPASGTSGIGLGLLGMRERAAGTHGEVEIGPRLTGGYRVRVRMPLEEDRA